MARQPTDDGRHVERRGAAEGVRGMCVVETRGGRSTPHSRAGRHAPRKTTRQAMDRDTTGAHRTLGGDGGADSPRNVGTLNPTDVLVPTRPCRRVAGTQQMPRGRHRGGYTERNRHCGGASTSPTAAAATTTTAAKHAANPPPPPPPPLSPAMPPPPPHSSPPATRPTTFDRRHQHRST